MKATVCNKCKKVITDNEARSKMFVLELRTERTGMFDQMHLCDDCKCAFYKFIKNEKILESEE